MKDNKTSRRSFVGKMTAGLFAAPFAGDRAWAHEWSEAVSGKGSGPFVSDKKFVPVMITPYRKDGRIDFDGLSRLMDFYMASGVKGFFANCQSSEMYFLSNEERLALTNHVVKYAKDGRPVVATGSFGDTLEEKAEFTRKIYDTGVKAVIMISSLFVKSEESDDVLIDHFEKFLSLTDNIPLGTYECPAPYKRILTPYVFRYLLGTNRLLYHKDTTIDLERVKEKIRLVGNNKLEFYDACVANTMYSLQAGARGMSAISGNFYPEILVWMCNNSTNPARQEDVKYIQANLTKTEDTIAENYPLSSKYFLQKRGLPIEVSSRIGSTPLSARQKQALDETYRVFSGWCERIGIEPARI